MPRNLYFAPAKRDTRRAADLSLLAVHDQLFAVTIKIIAQRGKVRLAAGSDTPITPTAIEYFERKKAALRASYFRQRYGRDYTTGERRHLRQCVRWWNQGYQDEVEGGTFWRRPESWSDARWRRYCDGVETAAREVRGDRDRLSA